MSEEKGKGLLIGFLSGAIVGGILALLYAPKSGKELPQDIKTRSGELGDDLQEYLQDVQTKAKDVIRIGLNLNLAPSSAASNNGAPRSCALLANSTIRMAFFAVRPMRTMRPIWA